MTNSLGPPGRRQFPTVQRQPETRGQAVRDTTLGRSRQGALAFVGAHSKNCFNGDTRNSLDSSHLMCGVALTFVVADRSVLKNIHVLPKICFCLFFFLHLTNQPPVYKTQMLCQQRKGLGELLWKSHFWAMPTGAKLKYIKKKYLY